MSLLFLVLLSACSGDEPARDAGTTRDAFLDLDSSGPAAACLERARSCSRTAIVSPEGQCVDSSRRDCVVGAPTCADLHSCYLGPRVDSGLDAGPVDGGPPIDGRCTAACYSCGYDYANDTGRSVDVCTGYCRDGATHDCILAATTCEEMDACVPP